MSEYIFEIGVRKHGGTYEHQREEIVRCRDCEHRYDNQCGRNLDWFNVELDDFCAWGERKERIEQ